MSRPPSRTFKIIATCGAIAFAGLIAGAWSYRTRTAELHADLLDDARRAAVAFDSVELTVLGAAPEDAATGVYGRVKNRLRKFKMADPRVRFVYLLRVKDGGRAVILADSSVPGSPGAATPGDEFPAALRLAGLQETIHSGRPTTDGPMVDEFGTWSTAYAPISGAAGIPGGRASDILALNIDAAHWRGEPWQAAAQGAFYVWLALGLPPLAWFVARRQLHQRHVIRNLSEAVEQSQSAIAIIGLDGRIEFVNRGFCAQTGYARNELVGREWRKFQVTDDAEDVLSEMLDAVHSGRPWEGEWFNRRQNGTTYPARGVVTPVKQRDGSLACFVAVFDDATEARAREAELREARDLAQAGDRAKGHFLATMSHEIRTPLNGIVGFTSLLLDTPLTTEQREYVQTIRMSTEALIQLTGDILDFARIESGKLKLDPIACDPRECVEDALDVLAPKADLKKLELLHRIEDDVPSAVVTDAGRLRQVLANLIGNAIKFTEQGEIEVRVRRLPAETSEPVPPAKEDAGEETCLLEFSVRDTGIGIAPENHAKLFRAFSQVDESTTRRYSGTGLGLAICRELVDLMGGAIDVRSELGRGATFTFTIRASVVARVAPSRNLAGLKLGLLVRREPLRQELTDLVRGWGGEVIQAGSVDQFATMKADVVLVEVDEDGAYDLAARPEPLFGFTSEKLFGLVPITLSSDLRAALRTHFRLLVNKPVHHDSFYALLAGSVGNTPPPPPPPPHFGFRVLVAEDNALNQRLAQRVLTTLGCIPTAVGNGRELLDLLKRRPEDFDLVLLDLHMPEMDGVDALHEMRAGNVGPQAQVMWVIALTADARDEQRAQAIAEGLNDFLTKPIKPGDLEIALRKFRTQRAARKR